MAENVPNASEDTQSYIHHLIWLDEDLENAGNQQKLNQIRELDEDIDAFTNAKRCVEHIKKLDERNTKCYILFIISGSLSEKVIPKIEDCKCILGIFIFDTKSEKTNDLQSDMITICTNIDQLINRIRSCMSRDNTSTDYSYLNLPQDTDTEAADEQKPIRNLKEDQARFLWFYKCHSFMLELEDNDQQAKEVMVNSCRQMCGEDRRALKPVKKFEEESLEDNAENAIWWYTQDSVIGRSMNEALVSGNIARIYSYRYLIKLICRQLTKLHKKYIKSYEEDTLRLYRGQILKLSQILEISQHRNDLISLNGFISTTKELDVAKKFCFGRKKKDHVPVIFKIDINMTSKQSIAFADISHLAHYPDEEEILLSVGSVFRIDSVRLDKTKLFYRIHLSLSSPDQSVVNTYIEQTFPNETNATDQSVLFGKLLFDMGEYAFAIEYYKHRIENLSNVDNHHRPTYLNNLGACYNAIGKTDEALKYYKAASRIYESTNNDRGLGACYHNMASYYYDEKDYNNALKYALKAFDKRQNDDLEKAATLDLLGCIQLANHNTDAAGDNLREALNIRLTSLDRINPNHPDIGMSYQNLGKLDWRSSSFVNAQHNYQRAEQIFRSNYPDSHLLMVDITKRLKDIGRRLGN